MKRGRVIVEEKTKTITGKDLSSFLGVHPGDYTSLYPNRPNNDKGNYCPCLDLKIGGECHGMITVMEVLTKNEIKEFPEGTAKVNEGEYKSGEVWIDKSYDIAYLYIGQSPKGRDVVLNLGGDTSNQGNIEAGCIDKRLKYILSFDRKVFPKG
jgi:hypothetical protein